MQSRIVRAILWLAVGSFCGLSCKREPAVETDIGFVGRWKHKFNNTSKQILTIGNDSRGYIEMYQGNQLEYDSNPRKWLVKDDLLMFGRLTGGEESFGIDTYPTTSASGFISG